MRETIFAAPAGGDRAPRFMRVLDSLATRRLPALPFVAINAAHERLSTETIDATLVVRERQLALFVPGPFWPAFLSSPSHPSASDTNRTTTNETNVIGRVRPRRASLAAREIGRD